MTESTFPSGKLYQMLRESAQRSSALHRQFMNARQEGLRKMRALIERQIAGNMPAGTAHPGHLQALFDSHQLDAFGSGLISQCFGPDFARYDGRRLPRIPNGDLKMMSRIMSIEGSPRSFELPASIVVEYDVPTEAWYFKDNASPEMPTSLYMEIALQPCGFLSAYLDTYALVPYEQFFFRNLDGTLRPVESIDVRGKTIQTRASLLSSVVSGGTVIQKFSFEMSCDGLEIYSGESTFGYFSAETMANQVGLDGGQQVLPDFHDVHGQGRDAVRVDPSRLLAPNPARPLLRASQGRLNFLDEVFIQRGGQYGKGSIYARRAVNPQDWFYAFHFYQDPVMPGSLGVEAILEAMRAYALANDLGSGMRSPRFGLLPGAPAMTWRYRGQITQQHRLMELEFHLKSLEQQNGGLRISGDASLWADGLRIYEVKNVTTGILDGEVSD